MLSLHSSQHTPTASIINLKFLWCDCFLSLLMGDLLLFPLRVFRPNLGTRFFLGGKAVTVRVFVMLDVYFVSVKYVSVCIKLVYVYVKLLKI
jgi:hypothetical protein